MKKVRPLNVAGRKVGVVGLDELLEERGRELAQLPPEAARKEMLEALSRDNYIPAGVRDAYGEAFYRELLRFAGLPVPTDDQAEPTVVILGPGCAQCDNLERTVLEILNQEGLQAVVEHVRDPAAIGEMGIVAVPALMVGRRVLFAGRVPPKGQVRKLLLSALGPSGSHGDER
ncbi:Thioredoxin domain-containing protein [Desulfacinum infernum DSM 9756]|uniref:Thioredoxin domain-containing protein n=1 Tax=Desulfacinum infernum DSM 9756 TaxID=1121391 RepID=A0A1M5G1L5_9BACT|nr:thioredoxin family protein [Desulfacinum infernum]SHF97700.1 Thioredoxin domain-containing protein [Desulfacinum infernum DSM 9756]